MIPTTSDRAALLRRLLADPEVEMATNVERARLTRPELRGRSHEDVGFDLRRQSDSVVLAMRQLLRMRFANAPMARPGPR